MEFIDLEFLAVIGSNSASLLRKSSCVGSVCTSDELRTTDKIFFFRVISDFRVHWLADSSANAFVHVG